MASWCVICTQVGQRERLDIETRCRALGAKAVARDTGYDLPVLTEHMVDHLGARLPVLAPTSAPEEFMALGRRLEQHEAADVVVAALRRSAVLRLAAHMEAAVEVLRDIMEDIEEKGSTRVQAAIAVLNHGGVGPRSTVELAQGPQDSLESRMQRVAALRERAAHFAALRPAEAIVDTTATDIREEAPTGEPVGPLAE